MLLIVISLNGLRKVKRRSNAGRSCGVRDRYLAFEACESSVGVTAVADSALGSEVGAATGSRMDSEASSAWGVAGWAPTSDVGEAGVGVALEEGSGKGVFPRHIGAT